MSLSREDIDHALRLRAISAGIDPESFFARLERTIGSTPDPSRALTNLSRFLEAGFSSSLLRDFHSHPILLDIFTELVGQSQYLADILVRNPEWLHWLTSTGVLRHITSMDELRAGVAAATAAFEHPNKKRDALKRFHRREILRIGAMDILGEAPLESIVGQLSALADVIIDESVAAARLSVLRGTNPGRGSELCVIGLGKLGGGELNFSSDIDLMFAYEEDRELRKPIGRISTTHELAVRMSEAIVEFLSGFSEEGYFYRVDMRLRPDGRSGPLALSRAGYVTYYESRGEQWERQMLIKARCVGGDLSLGGRVLADIRPFVYRRTMISSPWSDIASMKRAIEKEFRSEGNIKLGAGGIRDIEFLVQGLQLVHGGHHEDLRSSNTLETLVALAERGVIPPEEATDLREAYVMFRDVEHRLQLFHGFQTHDLPVDPEEFELLARKLGYPTERFRRLLNRHRKRVRSSFLAATHGLPADDEELTSEEREMLDPLREEGSRSLRIALMKDVRAFPPPELAIPRIGALLRAEANLPILREALSLPRLRSDIITSVSFSSILFERLSTDALLLDSLVGQAAALLRTARLGWIDLLRDDPARFKRYNEVRSSIRFLTGRTAVHQFEKELSDVAVAVVEGCCRASGVSEHLLVVGAGKLGSGEMGVSSDLDLLLFFDDEQTKAETAHGEGTALLNSFSSPSKSYDLDMRLRPEGRNAPLVAGLGYFKNYLLERAQLWEMLALKRARPLWGSGVLRNRYASAMRAVPLVPPAVVVSHVREMRSRMERERVASDVIHLKVGAGGIADIEFIAQTGLLLKRRRGGRSTVHSLRSLRTARMLRAREEHILLDSLSYLRTLEAILRLNSSVATSVLKLSPEITASVSRLIALPTGSDLLAMTRQRMLTVRHVFDRVMERWGG